MLDYFRGRRPWSQLDRLLPRLPRHSQYRAALDDDDEFATLVVDHLGGTTPPPPLAGYSEVAKRLDDVFDAVNAVNETLISIHSKKKSKPRSNRATRPEPAFQRLQRQRKIEKLDAIVDRMTGGR